ncbi:MAG: HNH endonuclease [Spirochaetales bacterium]|jgi:putative restriction endonuclease|nr:HNH endonuclease [Spirochaetales bacterium]
MNHKETFSSYIREASTEGSNRASSYIRAIDLLDSILTRKAAELLDAPSIWSLSSPTKIQQLYEFVLEQQRLGEAGIFEEETPVSYWRDRFCSAALKSYKEFLVIHPYEQQMWDIYNDETISEEERAAKLLQTEPESAEFLIDQLELDPKSKDGREALSTQKARRGQGFFRKMILKQYQNRCCVTGLDLPELCIASHIIGWADRTDTRMDPRNGLCLSATYDKAFDKHLITLDEDYRLVISKEIREHYRNDHAQELFENREGQMIWMPEDSKRRPLQDFLEIHRKQIAS